ncbi:unnamed protein product [Cyclocybe aegerita]|uniref:Uncharacterized protein n=1 Tax=Cyclocybe aegerita TaxID=1973307 RepID=A0A8S0Y0I5_CYCAE|nr:unnamed protein product [Cyclocybe aegerita]
MPAFARVRPWHYYTISFCLFLSLSFFGICSTFSSFHSSDLAIILYLQPYGGRALLMSDGSVHTPDFSLVAPHKAKGGRISKHFTGDALCARASNATGGGCRC